MTMKNNPFLDVMRQHSNEELLLILGAKRADYVADAIAAAEEVLGERGVTFEKKPDEEFVQEERLKDVNNKMIDVNNEEKEMQEFVNGIYRYAAELMFERKKSKHETKKILVEKGLREEDADVVIANLQAEAKQAKREAGSKNMLYGALWCIGGTVVTLVTYSSASEGDSYIVAWGAIIFGAIQFLRGLFQKNL